jgi:hypothetical protein
VPSFREMSYAVTELVELERKRLRDLEDMTHRRGFEPGPDMAFAGVRLAVAEGAAAAQFLLQLADIEGPFKIWLDEQQRATEAVTSTSPLALSKTSTF